MPLKSRHLLGLDGMPREDIQLILDTAVSFREVLDRPIKKVPPLQGKTIANLFFENSTRTRLSFELAERRLSADVLGFAASGSSVSKGETLKDTARNIEAMKIDMVVMRHGASGAPTTSPGSSSQRHQRRRRQHEHPTASPRHVHHSRRNSGAWTHVRILGDILHSRVARSNIFGLIRWGQGFGLRTRYDVPRVEKLGVHGPTTSTIPAHGWAVLSSASSSNGRRTLFPDEGVPQFYGIGGGGSRRAAITIMHPDPSTGTWKSPPKSPTANA